MMSAGFARSSLVLACATALLASCSGRARKPSIALVVIDTLRADELDCYGSSVPTSPVLARLSADGVTFDDLFAASPLTTTSVATILTGLYPDEAGVRGLRFPLSSAARTLAERLSEVGYTAGAVLSNAAAGPLYGFDQGYKEVHYENYIEDQRKPGASSRPTFTADRVTDRALEMVPKLGSPFFLYVHYTDPHAPYLPPDGWAERYLAGRPPLEESQLSQHSFHHLNPEQSERARAYYRGEVAFTDRELGRLLAGLPPDTLVLVTADHGEEFRDHGGMGHGHTLFQELLHVPLIVKGRGLSAGRRVREPVTHADIAPTILDFAGAPQDAALSGLSLRGLLDGSARDPAPRPLFSILESATGPWRSARLGRWKLHCSPDRRLVLFDVETDPHERDNVANERGAEVAQLLAALDHRRTHVIDPPAETNSEEDKERLEQIRALGYVQ